MLKKNSFFAPLLVLKRRACLPPRRLARPRRRSVPVSLKITSIYISPNYHRWTTAFAVMTLLASLTSCSALPDWLGSSNKPKIAGERFAVMEGDEKIAPDADTQIDQVEIPPETKTPSNGFNSGNYHLNGDLSDVKSVSGGEVPDENFILSYPPAVSDGIVYVVDGRSNVNAFDAATLAQKWHKKSDAAKKDRDLPGGGVEYAYNILFVSTGAGEVMALSAVDGSQIWKHDLGAPLRHPPIVEDDKVYAVTINNQLFALSVIDGKTMWRHSGASESTSFYGSANPAVKGDVTVVNYSSGEVFGISNTHGNELWSELTAATTDRRKVSSSLSDTVSPVVADGIAYIGSRSGNFIALNSGNGSTVWENKLGSVDSTPWVAGRFIFTVAEKSKLVALNRFTGKIKWVIDLPLPKEADKDKLAKLVWSGPVMAGGKLITIASDGRLVTIDPKNGAILKTLDIPEGIFEAPIIAEGALYMMTREAGLVVVK